jgi:Zn-dependent metalloprotease
MMGGGFMKFIFSLFLIVLTGCVTESHRKISSVDQQQLLESPDAQKRQKLFVGKRNSEIKAKASQGSFEQHAQSNDAVAVYLLGQETKYIQKPSRSYNINTMKSNKELAALMIYIDSYKQSFNVSPDANLKLRVHAVTKNKDRAFVKIEQYVERKVSGKTYQIPIVGSNLVVTLKDKRVVSVLSAIANPPSISLVLQNPGFDLSKVSAKELELMRQQMVDFGKVKAVKTYFSKVAANSGTTFDFDSWLNSSSDEQMNRLQQFFASIKRTSTAKMLIDLARLKRLAFVNRGGTWNFQVTQPFDLPLEFDLQIPKQSTNKLVVKNIRDLRKEISIEVHSSPNFPSPGVVVSADGEVRTPGKKIDNVTVMFQAILSYYRQIMGWVGPNGQDSSFEVLVHKDISVGKAAQNAYWSGHSYPPYFGIGAGGNQLYNLENSLTVLGHEYGHAIVQNTSGLVYQGESGALNEHFADVQGAMIESTLKNEDYRYVIGEDVITPEAAAPKKTILGLTLLVNKVPQSDIETFNLRALGLRHLYEPSLSFNAQPATVQQGLEMFGSSCQPSAENDQCGVHYLSGIPNRATSMIISRLGFKKVESLFFNTTVNRLSMFSNFSEYLRQMHQECLESGQFQSFECDVVLESFASVGVVYPEGHTSDQNPFPDNIPNDEPPTPQKPASQTLKMCGWISISASKNITVIDNKYDAVILNPANAQKFGGDYTKIQTQDFNLFSHKDCGCVTGTISQTPNSKNVWFNYFLDVVPGAVQKHKTTSGCQSIIFK